MLLRKKKKKTYSKEFMGTFISKSRKWRKYQGNERRKKLTQAKSSQEFVSPRLTWQNHREIIGNYARTRSV